MARRAGGTHISGVQAYRAALRLRAAVAERVQVVEGSVTAHVAGIGVVACPCLQSLQNFGIGAQAQGALGNLLSDASLLETETA